MHPILFHIPLPSFNLPLAWIPLIVAALAALVAAAKMIGADKDRSGAAIAAVVAIGGLVARFGFMRGYTETWAVTRIPIYSYGVMLGLSLVVGWYLTLGLAKRDGLPPETMANNYVVTAVVAVLGSRVLYILTNLNEFDTFASMFAMRRGGLVAYGGFLGGLAGSYFFLRRHRIPLLPWADVAVPSLASGLMITRIGCYLFGCDFGQPLKDSAPAFLKKLGTFPHWAEHTLEHGDGSPAFVQHVHDRGLSPTALASLPVHPTQLYESAVGLGLLVLLLWARKKQQFRGQIFFLFAFAYGVCRYLLEILRDDKERGSIPPELPEHILIPLGLTLLSIGWVIGFSKVIENKTFQRATQVLAFVPPLALYLLMKPDSFASAATNQLSTSQFIAISSGFAASIAFAVFHKAALAHPRQAMALNLPPEAGAEGSAPAPVVDEEEDDEEEEERQPVKRPVARKGKAKGKLKTKAAKAKPAEDEDDEDAAAEDAKKPAEEPKEAEEEPKKADKKADEEEDDEPGKAG
jgi:phosphatidylglycerol:prolipoprotein diacylglycerol transferase